MLILKNILLVISRPTSLFCIKSLKNNELGVCFAIQKPRLRSKSGFWIAKHTTNELFFFDLMQNERVGVILLINTIILPQFSWEKKFQQISHFLWVSSLIYVKNY